MKQAIAQGPQAGRGSQFVVYDDAGHAFFADYRPSYKKADAEDGWRARWCGSSSTAWVRRTRPSCASNGVDLRFTALDEKAVAALSGNGFLFDTVVDTA